MSTTSRRATLLVELLTEELPPKALPRLGETFAAKITEGLKAKGLVAAEVSGRSYASPRRLAVTVAQVAAEAEAQEVTEKLMPVAVALDAEGRPTPALLKKMAAKGIAVEALAHLERRMDGKAEALFHTARVPGAKLADVLADIVQDAVKALPIPKVMRWGDGEATFVRPVHKLIMLHGDDVVPGRVLDLDSGRTTRGHRFMSRGDIDIATADAYEPTLLAEGKVIACLPSGAPTSRRNCWPRQRAKARNWASTPTCWMKSLRWSSIPRCTWASSRRSFSPCRRSV